MSSHDDSTTLIDWPEGHSAPHELRLSVRTSLGALRALRSHYGEVYVRNGRFSPDVGERAGVLLGVREKVADGRWDVRVLGFEETSFENTSEVHMMGSTRALFEAGQRGRKRLDLPHMVGWYHTHPTGPIFLSPPDLATFQALFPDPYWLAMVIDPGVWRAGYFARPVTGRIDPSEAAWRELSLER